MSDPYSSLQPSQSADPDGYVLVSPHRFASLEWEQQSARDAGLSLIAASDKRDFRSRLAHARAILLTPYARIDREAAESLTACIAIVRYGVGVDNIDIDAATDCGIPVANVPDASVEEVATHGLALALALLRRLGEAGQSIREGKWTSEMMRGTPRFSTATVGIVGAGRIGLRAARMYAALGATVLLHDPVVHLPDYEMVELDDLLARSDVVSLHVPLTDITRNMIGAAQIACMRPGAVLINVSRGGLVDEAAVAEALHDGQLGGAGIDVFAIEPLPPDSPLRSAPRTILTPHVAWRSDSAAVDLQRMAVEQLTYALRGEPMPNALNPSTYSDSRRQ